MTSWLSTLISFPRKKSSLVPGFHKLMSVCGASANKILNACTLRHGRTNQHYVKKLQRHIEEQMKMSFTQGYFILPEINTSKENQEWYNRVELETLDLAMRYIEDID